MNLGLELIRKLKPIKFKYKDKKGLESKLIHFGFLAQELEKILPKDQFALVKADDEGFLMVEYTQLIAPIIKSIQEIDQRMTNIEEHLKRQQDQF